MPVPIFIFMWLISTLLSYLMVRQAYKRRRKSWTLVNALLTAFLAFCMGPVGVSFAFLFNIINDERLQ